MYKRISALKDELAEIGAHAENADLVRELEHLLDQIRTELDFGTAEQTAQPKARRASGGRH